MLVLAKPQKVIGTDFAGQAETFRAQPDPFAGDAVFLLVVIADTAVFLEVFAGVRGVVLRVGCDHAPDTLHGLWAHLVYPTHQPPEKCGEVDDAGELLN